MERSVAFLVYKSWRPARRKNDSFDGLSNIGAYMLIDKLKRSGIEVDFCSVDSAKKYKLVLISFTSALDILAFGRVVINHPDWKKRKFTTVGGGFGMQNPMAVKQWLDYSWFGRGENDIIDIVKANGHYESISMMDTNKPKVSKIAQSKEIYPYGFNYPNNAHGKDQYKETIMGCPNKCFYCHYSWARKHIDKGKHFELSLYASSQELDMFNVEQYDPKVAQLTAGLDGYSERLRKIVNRQNTNQDIKDFILGVSQRTQITGKALFLRLYNIIGYETETIEDWEEFKNIIIEIEPKIKKRILLTTHSTPLRPSPATPMAFAELQPITHLKQPTGIPVLKETDNLLWFTSRFEEGEFARLEMLLVERFTEQYRDLFTMIVTNKKFNSLPTSKKWYYVKQKYNLTDLYREYDVTEQIPSWFLEGYKSMDAIKKLRLQMKRKMND